MNSGKQGVDGIFYSTKISVPGHQTCVWLIGTEMADRILRLPDLGPLLLTAGFHLRKPSGGRGHFIQRTQIASCPPNTMGNFRCQKSQLTSPHNPSDNDQRLLIDSQVNAVHALSRQRKLICPVPDAPLQMPLPGFLENLFFLRIAEKDSHRCQ